MGAEGKLGDKQSVDERREFADCMEVGLRVS